MRTTLAAFALITLLSSAALAVPFGQPDGGRHPYVGTLLFQTGSGWYSCSGTLIAPKIVLTAGHCTEENNVPNLNTYVKFTPEISFAGYVPGTPVLDYLNNPANGWYRGTAMPHPMYDDYAQFPRTYDIGVVILDSAIQLPAYGALPPQGFLETIVTHRSQTSNRFTIVGYGMQGFIKPFYSDLWARYFGSVRLIELNSTLNAGQSAKFTSNPGQGGGSCYGDSGGPIFYGDTNMITAVVSWGRTPCIGNSYEFRTDTALALAFVNQYLPGGPLAPQ